MPSREEQIQALIEEEVARAMRPYRDLGLSTEVLGELERLLRVALENHPTPQHLLRVLADEPMVAHSDTVNVSSLGKDRKKKGESA